MATCHGSYSSIAAFQLNRSTINHIDPTTSRAPGMGKEIQFSNSLFDIDLSIKNLDVLHHDKHYCTQNEVVTTPSNYKAKCQSKAITAPVA